jgi:lysophospholipase
MVAESPAALYRSTQAAPSVRGLARDPSSMTLHDIPVNPVPEGAMSGHLVTQDGLSVRYARWGPLAARRGTVVLLNGRADMIEKYFEVVSELRERGFSVATLDWRGQGGSQRLLSDPRKGHVRRFEDYQLDLEVLMREVVLPDCPPPIFVLAHSMAAVIVLEALRSGRRWFDRTVLTSPMIQIQRLPSSAIVRAFLRFGTLIGFGRAYIPGGGPAAITNRPFLNNPVSSDPVRYERNAAIVEAHPELALGSPTVGWTRAAYRLMDALNDPSYPAGLRQPLLIISAGDDSIVSTAASERFASRLRAGAHLIVTGSRHEILMERDVFREQFLAAFDAFIPGSPLYR